MTFEQTPIKGMFIVHPLVKEDKRGFFSRNFCAKSFKAAHLPSAFVQTNVSRSQEKKTTRGLHYQLAPYAEDKLIRCLQGSIFDVCVDLRPNSSTYLKWHGETLSADNHKMLFIPKGCAHGYQTLTKNSLIMYHVSQYYTPEAERGIRWDDPSLKILWPFKKDIIISKKDSLFPYLENFAIKKEVYNERSRF